jgi:ABC-type transport system substrate-binding protein
VLRGGLAAVAFALASALVGCRGCSRAPVDAGPAAGPPLREAIYSEPGSFDPREQSEAETFSILYPVFDTLVEVDGAGQVKPALAESWETKDQQRWTFHLRRNVRFHSDPCLAGDGARREVHAEDVVASLNRALLPGSTGRGMLADILDGAEELEKGATEARGLRVVDPFTVEVLLKAPNRQLLDRLALPYFFVLSSACVRHYGPELKRHAVGTGPFRVVDVKPGYGVRLARNDEYWRTDGGQRLPYLPGVEFRFVADPPTALAELVAGRLDAVDVPPTLATELARSRAYEPFRKLEALALDTHYLVLRTDRSPFRGNTALRQALNLAVDKRHIVDGLLGGNAVPSRGIFPPALFSAPSASEAFPYDLKRARALLAASGHPGGKGLPELVLGIDNKPTTEALAVYVRDALGRIGVRVRLKTMDFGTLVAEATAGKLDFFYLFVEGDFTHSFYAQQVDGPGPEAGGLNFSHHADATVTRLLQAASASREPEVRAAWLRLSDAAVESAPWVFLYHSKRVRLVAPDIDGYEHDPMQIRRYASTRRRR